MLGMALRRDVACCVKIVGILAVDSDLEKLETVVDEIWHAFKK